MIERVLRHLMSDRNAKYRFTQLNKLIRNDAGNINNIKWKAYQV